MCKYDQFQMSTRFLTLSTFFMTSVNALFVEFLKLTKVIEKVQYEMIKMSEYQLLITKCGNG